MASTYLRAYRKSFAALTQIAVRFDFRVGSKIDWRSRKSICSFASIELAHRGGALGARRNLRR
jgi:hypothetical protein